MYKHFTVGRPPFDFVLVQYSPASNPWKPLEAQIACASVQHGHHIDTLPTQRARTTGRPKIRNLPVATELPPLQEGEHYEIT